MRAALVALALVSAATACSNARTTSDAATDVDVATDSPTATDSSDVAIADASPLACDRATATRTAPSALLDALNTDVTALSDPSARAARDAQFIADVRARGGTPLQGSGEVVFVAEGAGPFSVGLSTHGWMPADAPMDPIAGTDLYVRHEAIADGTRAEYKLVENGTTWLEDPLAQNVVWDGINHNAVGQFNGVVHPAAGDPNVGRLVALRQVPSVADHDPRDVFVYLPAAYDQSPTCAVMPLVFVHDGNESLTRVPFQSAADMAFASGTRPAILAFVALPNQNIRIDEYTFDTPTARGDAYGHFLFDELDPLLSARFRVRAGRDCRGLAGASLGGLISMYLGYTRFDRAALVGAQSGSFFWNSQELVHTVMTGPMRDLRAYLDSGDSGASQDNLPDVTAMADALAARGYDHTRVQQAGAIHDWVYWAQRWPGMLAWILRPGRCD
jgi:enterochelin esterase family protein